MASLTEASAISQPLDLDKLPLLVIDSILTYIIDRDGLRSVSAFSLTSRGCASIAAKFRLAQITLSFQGPRQLFSHVQTIQKISPQDLSFLRKIKITGIAIGDEIEDAGEADGGSRGQPGANHDADQQGDENEDEGYDDDDDDFFQMPKSEEGQHCNLRHTHSIKFNPFSLPPTEEQKRSIQAAWLPLANILGGLPNLEDLIYESDHQIPSCLLTALKDHCPNTRLHVHTFSLRSLIYEEGNNRDIDPDEYLLVTSPNLHCIVGKACRFDNKYRWNYTPNGMVHMIQGLAANLKSIAMWQHYQSDDLATAHMRNRNKPPWGGFNREELDDDAPYVPGRIEHLIYTADLAGIGWSTNFNHLRTLACAHQFNDWDLGALAGPAQRQGLGSLRSLTMTIDTSLVDTFMATEGPANKILQVANPLLFLKLSGISSEAPCRTIINRHSGTLRRLELIPCMARNGLELPLRISHQLIDELAFSCANLEYLRIQVPRMQGNGDEAAIYRNLGRMPRLRRVHLYLDCANYRGLEEQFGEEDMISSGSVFQGIPRICVSETLINVAIDSNLAGTIFEKMTTGASKINYLKLEPTGAGYFGLDSSSQFDEALNNVTTWIGRKYVCKKDAHGKRSLKEIPQDGQDGWVLKEDFRTDDFHPHHVLRDIWTNIWPGPAGDRRSHWASYPIANIG